MTATEYRGSGITRTGPFASLSDPNRLSVSYNADAPTEPLALVAAALRALQAQQEGW